MASFKLPTGGMTSKPRGWGDQVLDILFTIFVVAIVFGVLLIATSITSTTITQTQSYTNSITTGSNSVNALLYGGANTVTPSLKVVLTGDYANVSTSTSLTLALTGNVVKTVGTNTVHPVIGLVQTQTFTITTAPTNTLYGAGTVTGLTGVGNFYNITTVSLSTSGSLYNFVGGVTATVTEPYNAIADPDTTNTYATNTISAAGTLSVTGATIGTGTSTALSVFSTLVGYLVTLANFTGIIVLLAIIVVVVGVLYYFFGNRSNAAFEGGSPL